MKLNQLIAVANGKKARTTAELTRIHHLLQKTDLLTGITRTYRPKDEDGDVLPKEEKHVQLNALDLLREAQTALVDLFDLVACQDATNCEAKADVVVDGLVLLPRVAVTTLLFLEKQLVDLHTLVSKLPVLDPTEVWRWDDATAMFRSEATDTTRTKKVPKAFVAYEATDKHPAQVQMFTEDVVAGYWTTVKFSGAIKESMRKDMLARIVKVQEAVKQSRESANMTEAAIKTIGDEVLGYIFGK